MAIDPSIALGAQPIKLINPLDLAMNVQQMRSQRLENQVRQEQINKAREANELVKAQDTAMQGATGLDDYLARLTQAGHGHLAPVIRKQWGEADEAAEKAKQARAAAAVAEADYFGGLAASVRAWEKDGPEAVQNAATLALAHAKQGGHDVGQIETVLKQNPAALPQVLEALLQASPKQRELLDKEKGTGIQGLNATTTAANVARQIQDSDAARPGVIADAALKQQITAGTKGGVTPAQQLTDKREQERIRLEGQRVSIASQTNKREQAKYDQTYGAGVSETGAALPANPVAKAIAEYRVPPPSPRSMATPAGMALMRQIEAINPGFDATKFPARNKMRTAFTSGPQGLALNSLNTAIEHLDQFVGFAQTMGGGNFQPTNELKNWIKTQFGDTAPTDFEGIKTIMAGELAAAFKKSGATDQEIEAVESSIKSKASAAQLVSYATKVAIPALGSKAATYESQWRATMGDSDPYTVYTPGAQSVLNKYKAGHGAGRGAAPERRPIPGVPGGVAELRDGKWIRVQ